MKQPSFLTIFFIITMSSMTSGQNFNSFTSQIFFNIDVKRQDTTLISDLRAIPDLILKKETGWTINPPLDKKFSPIPYFTFSFSEHSYFATDFNSGQLMVMTNEASDRIMGMWFSISFDSEKTFDSTYKSIKKLFGIYSSKTIRRPNIARPFEVTKYLSKGDNDYVIITKGESDKKPYIHIAYNYQGYEW